MLDWKPGDKLVAVKTTEKGDSRLANFLPRLVIGREYEIYQLHEAGKGSTPCVDNCGSDIIVVTTEQLEKNLAGYCSCCFRRPINFQRYFNLSKLVKPKVPINA